MWPSLAKSASETPTLAHRAGRLPRQTNSASLIFGWLAGISESQIYPSIRRRRKHAASLRPGSPGYPGRWAWSRHRIVAWKGRLHSWVQMNTLKDGRSIRNFHTGAPGRKLEAGSVSGLLQNCARIARIIVRDCLRSWPRSSPLPKRPRHNGSVYAAGLDFTKINPTAARPSFSHDPSSFSYSRSMSRTVQSPLVPRYDSTHACSAFLFCSLS